MNNRIRKVRKELNLSQTALGDKLKCSRDKIANIELGRVNPDDLFISHFCRELHISEEWLRTGNGDMIKKPSDLYELIGASLGELSELEEKLLRNFLSLNKEQRKAGIKFLQELVKD